MEKSNLIGNIGQMMKKTLLILMLVFMSNAIADDHDLSGKTYPVKNIISKFISTV